MEKLIKQAEALGIKVDKRWKEDRLREEIAKVQPAEPATEVVEEEEDVVVQEEAGVDADAAAEQPAADSDAKPGDGDAAPETELAGVTIKNMTPSRNKRLGIDPHGTVVLTSEQLSDRQFMARIDHGVKTGVLGIA